MRQASALTNPLADFAQVTPPKPATNPDISGVADGVLEVTSIVRSVPRIVNHKCFSLCYLVRESNGSDYNAKRRSHDAPRRSRS